MKRLVNRLKNMSKSTGNSIGLEVAERLERQQQGIKRLLAQLENKETYEVPIILK